jgi:hypothetical protein
MLEGPGHCTPGCLGFRRPEDRKEAQVEGCRLMQSRWLSFVESITNIVVGYALAVLTQMIVFPLFGLHASLSENLLIGCFFVGVSLVRSFAIRRLFNGAWVASPGRDQRKLTIR